jgi:hypothetical protein
VKIFDATERGYGDALRMPLAHRQKSGILSKEAPGGTTLGARACGSFFSERDRFFDFEVHSLRKNGLRRPENLQAAVPLKYLSEVNRVTIRRPQNSRDQSNHDIMPTYSAVWIARRKRNSPITAHEQCRISFDDHLLPSSIVHLLIAQSRYRAQRQRAKDGVAVSQPA